uniref:serine hydrolase domain-containing protein n=1 Tax=Fodinicola feengrottensis TaxID=435914 RepID=UPI00244372B8|nr:serine hydrolase [Fodinicola feengrottensis]
MSHLVDFVGQTADKWGIPAVAVGVWAGGQEWDACHGVTSLENPLPVDRDTIYALGSVSKTVTATMVMRLVADRLVELDAPVRRYVPNLKAFPSSRPLGAGRWALGVGELSRPGRPRPRADRVRPGAGQRLRGHEQHADHCFDQLSRGPEPFFVARLLGRYPNRRIRWA